MPESNVKKPWISALETGTGSDLCGTQRGCVKGIGRGRNGDPKKISAVTSAITLTAAKETNNNENPAMAVRQEKDLIIIDAHPSRWFPRNGKDKTMRIAIPIANDKRCTPFGYCEQFAFIDSE